MALQPRQPFVGLAIAAVAGIGAADLLAGDAPVLWQPAAAAAAIAFLLAAWLAVQDRSLPRALEAGSLPASRFTTRAAVWFAFTALFFAWHAYWQGAGPARRLANRISAPGCVLRAIGVVNEEPMPEQRFRVRLESVAFNDRPLEPWPAEILVSKSGEPPGYGDRIEIVGTARNLQPPHNPGGFESLKQRRRQGIFSEIRVRYPNDAKVLAHDRGHRVMALAYRLRHSLERMLALDLEDRPVEVALIRCMVLGSRTEDSMREIQDQFQYTGAIHLYAVTGMNVILLAGMAAWLLQAFAVPRRFVYLALLALIWLYAFVTGLGTSTLRATVMISVLLIGAIVDRPALSWNSLGIATVAVLAWAPGQVFKHGFVFSFLIVAVMMVSATPLQKRLEQFAPPDPFLPRVLRPKRIAAWGWLNRKIAEWIAAGVTAWIGSIPLMLYYFHLWSPSTLPANLLGGLLTFVVIGLGIGSALVGVCSHWLAATFNNANWLFAKGLLWVVTTSASAPGGYTFVEWPSMHRAPVCEVEALDVPAGAAIHVRINGNRRRDWLIDCGSVTAFPRIVLPYLHSRGVNRLDGFVVTHGDSKHIGGASEVLLRLSPEQILDSALADRSSHRKALHTGMAASGLGKSIVARGDVITIAPGVTLHVLFPPEGLSARSADDKALVLRLDVASPGQAARRILFTSDAGFITEHWLLEHAAPEELRCDVIVKGLHSKDLSGTPEFLQAVQPKLVIASSTDFPPNEQVSDEWVATAQAQRIQVLRQDRSGAVKLTVGRNGAVKAAPFVRE